MILLLLLFNRLPRSPLPPNHLPRLSLQVNPLCRVHSQLRGSSECQSPHTFPPSVLPEGGAEPCPAQTAANAHAQAHVHACTHACSRARTLCVLGGPLWGAEPLFQPCLPSSHTASLPVPSGEV